MKYRNGKEFLPTELLKELQKYVQGELVYIPKRESKRAGWGENNGTRMTIQKRNREIYRLHTNGVSTEELSLTYHLSVDSIRKIVSKTRKHEAKLT